MRTSPSIVLAVCAALWTIALVPGSAVGDDPPPEATRVLAFGDSITLGYGDLGVTCDGPAIGYPARLNQRFSANGDAIEVINAGQCGETSSAGVTRLDSLLSGQHGVVALMEGTNDISVWTSVLTIKDNIAEMARKAEEAGALPLILSVVPRGPGSGRDSNNFYTETLAGWLAYEADMESRLFADPFTAMISIPNLFDFYADPWHPDGSGYDLLTDILEPPVRHAVEAANVEPVDPEPFELQCDDGLPTGPCEPDAETLCLRDGRFRLEVAWRDFDGATGFGQAVPLTSDTGYFWFFRDTNVELITKALDGQGLNGNFWLFYGALTNVAYSMRVSDTATGSCRIYDNPSGTFASVGDTDAFPGDGSAPAQASLVTAPDDTVVEVPDQGTTPCEPSDEHLCLDGGRFRMGITWTDFRGNTGVGHAVTLTDDTGYFWFFRDTNVEVVAKVLDGRPLNGHHWVFYGALSNVAYTLTVTDLATGETRTYDNPLGNFASLGDTMAFPADL